MMKVLVPMFILLGMSDGLAFPVLVFGFFFLCFVVELMLVCPCSLSSFFLVDSLSVVLVLLTLWVVAMMLMVSGGALLKSDKASRFYFLICCLALVLVLAFFSSSMLSFYIFFELSLVPIVYLVLGWGYQPERLQASFYLLAYTVSASLPLLVSILHIYRCSGHVCFFLRFWCFVGDSKFSILWWGFLVLAFLVKVPMFLFHLWLPKAHVESPLVGSMILAGVLLKLGGYGLIRLLNVFYYVFPSGLVHIIMSVSLWGAVVCGFVCLRQSDLKALIAYSSVVHMGVMVGGVMSMTSWGVYGAIVTMVAHGLVSSSMFLGANMMYKVYHTRSIYLVKGVINVFPLMSFLWFLSLAANMGMPPSLNLIGEVLLVGGVLSVSYVFVVALLLSLFLSAAYSLMLYTFTQNGFPSPPASRWARLSLCDCVCMLLHLVPVFFLFTFINYVFM